jgi:sulfopropanediol 3-dehydrogenase
MRIYKNGKHRLFENDPETASVVSQMLIDLEKNGWTRCAIFGKVRRWNPESFELPIGRSTRRSRSSTPMITDTDFCQNNVREFAKAQLLTLKTPRVESAASSLGHKHIPVHSVAATNPRRPLSDVRFRPDEHYSGKGRGGKKHLRLHAVR